MPGLEKENKSNSSLRLAELIAALSIATDFGMGQPVEYALNTCILAVRLGESLGLSKAELREIYYLSLLRHIGCNAETYRMADVVGDELALRTEVAKMDTARSGRMMQLIFHYIRQAHEEASPFELARLVAQDLLTFPKLMQQEFAGFCEVAQLLAARLGFDKTLLRDLGQAYERWDGKGMPAGLKGEQISPAVHLVTLAGDVVTFYRDEGRDAALVMVKERRGKLYSPRLVDHFCEKAVILLSVIEDAPTWDTVLALEPGEKSNLSEAELDTACRVMAEFADIKSPYMVGHSAGVAALAEAAAVECGLPAREITILKRAALLHDIGRVGVSAGIWGKAGPLSQREWEQVRLHPYYTERILARPQALAQVGKLASHHHERLDGSGYHHSANAAQLPLASRLLAVADAYRAMLETRPHRPALSPEQATAELLKEVKAGRFDRETVTHVLAAAGQAPRLVRREARAGLSEREFEILRLIARGQSTRQIAGLLFISPKTVDNHIQHIYNKTGVSTRAGATLYAMEQNLLPDIKWEAALK
jgi:HD-GYP domain-containing protein (c-di-GMP phosphodiesterase class II)